MTGRPQSGRNGQIYIRVRTGQEAVTKVKSPAWGDFLYLRDRRGVGTVIKSACGCTTG